MLSDCGADGAGVRPWFERTFRDMGCPGAAYGQWVAVCVHGPGRLSQVAVWWLKLGIHLDGSTRATPSRTGATSAFIDLAAGDDADARDHTQGSNGASIGSDANSTRAPA